MRIFTKGEWLVSVASLLVTGASIFAIWHYTVGSPDALGWPVYAFSEWLINYNGGFVRRGLAGAIIEWLTHGGSALRLTSDWVFFQYASFAVLFLCLAFARARANASAILLSILIPAGIASMARNNDFYPRKEILFIVVLEIACLLFVLLMRTANRFVRHVWFAVLLAFVFAAGAVLPFVHEGYVFYGAPAIFILLLYVARAFPDMPSLKWLPWIYPVLPIFGFIISSIFKGDQAVAIAIWNSLAQSDRALISPAAPAIPSDAIMTIGYTAFNGLAHSANVILSGGFWLWVFVGGCVFLLLTVFTVTLYSREETPNPAAASLSLLPLLFMASLPIYVVSSDWGRSIANVSMSYLVLAYALYGQVSPPLVPAIAERLVPLVRFAGQRRRLGYSFAVVFSLTFNYPECCLSLGPESNPFAPIYSAIKRDYHAITPGAEWVDRLRTTDGHTR